MSVTELARFNVVASNDEDVLETLVGFHQEDTTDYGLIVISQKNADSTYDTVCMTREQLANLATIAKGH